MGASRFALLAVLGCAAPVAEVRPDPADGRSAWIAALESGDPGRVWGLLSLGTRRAWKDRGEFDAWFRRHGADLLVDALSAPAAPEESVVLTGGVEVVRSAEGWRVRRSILEGAARTPLEALQRLHGLLEQMGGAGRDTLAPSLAASVRRLADRVAAAAGGGEERIVVTKDRARVDLGDGLAVTLVRAAGGWTVESFPPP